MYTNVNNLMEEWSRECVILFLILHADINYGINRRL